MIERAFTLHRLPPLFRDGFPRHGRERLEAERRSIDSARSPLRIGEEHVVLDD